MTVLRCPGSCQVFVNFVDFCDDDDKYDQGVLPWLSFGLKAQINNRSTRKNFNKTEGGGG